MTRGTATFAGRRYVDIDKPVHHVGAVLEATSFHPGRRAEDHLKMVAVGAGIPLIPGRRDSRTGRSLRRRPGAGSGNSRWACASGCSWPPPYSGTRRSSSWTSPPTVSTHRASNGCARSSVTRPRSAMRCWSPPTFSQRWKKPSMTWSSSPTAAGAADHVGRARHTGRDQPPDCGPDPGAAPPRRRLQAVPVAFRQVAADTLVIDRGHPRVVRPAGRSEPDSPLRAGPGTGQPRRGLPEPDPRLRCRRSGSERGARAPETGTTVSDGATTPGAKP